MLGAGYEVGFVKYLFQVLNKEELAAFLPKFREDPDMGEIEIMLQTGILSREERDEDSTEAVEVAPNTGVFQQLLNLQPDGSR